MAGENASGHHHRHNPPVLAPCRQDMVDGEDDDVDDVDDVEEVDRSKPGSMWTDHGVLTCTELSSAALHCTNLCRAVLHNVAPKQAAVLHCATLCTVWRHGAPHYCTAHRCAEMLHRRAVHCPSVMASSLLQTPKCNVELHRTKGRHRRGRNC